MCQRVAQKLCDISSDLNLPPRPRRQRALSTSQARALRAQHAAVVRCVIHHEQFRRSPDCRRRNRMKKEIEAQQPSSPAAFSRSSSSSSRDESFCTCLEHAWSAMKLCSFMRMGELLAQQPVLSGAVVFGVCVCCRVSTRVVQTCAVALRGSVGSTRRVIHTNITIHTPGRVHTKQGHLWAKQPVQTIP